MTYRERRRRLAIGFASIALLGASPALAADDIRSEIEAANKVLEAAVGRSDGPGVAALYTDNGQLLPAQSDFVTGTLRVHRWVGDRIQLPMSEAPKGIAGALRKNRLFRMATAYTVVGWIRA